MPPPDASREEWDAPEAAWAEQQRYAPAAPDAQRLLRRVVAGEIAGPPAVLGTRVQSAIGILDRALGPVPHVHRHPDEGDPRIDAILHTFDRAYAETGRLFDGPGVHHATDAPANEDG